MALNETPSKLINDGRLRNDFYQRINTFEFTIPPLRERTSDIPDLVNLFINEFSKKYNKNIQKVSKQIIKSFKSHSWKEGNIRALKSTIERIVLFADDDEISLTSLPENFEVDKVSQIEDVKRTLTHKPLDYDKLLGLPHDDFLRFYFEHQMEIHKGNISSAANSLGMPRTTLQSKLDELGVDPTRFR